MNWKAVVIFIYFLSTAFTGVGFIYPGMPQIDYNIPIEKSSNGDPNRNYYSENGQVNRDFDQSPCNKSLKDRPGSFLWPNPNGINIANINGENGYINQNISQNALVDKCSATGFVGSSYTINFFNINYGSLLDKKHKESLQGSRLQHYPSSMKEVLKQLAENAKILERERKENMELLKQIAS